jgi:hypothetical protein
LKAIDKRNHPIKRAHRHLKLLGNSFIRLGRKKALGEKEGGFDLPSIKPSAGRPNPLPPAFGLRCLALLYGEGTGKIFDVDQAT